MEEIYEDYLEQVLEIALKEHEIPKEEILYNNEHFENCYNDGISVEEAISILTGFCN